jgi:hypothetical protein
MIKKYRVVKFIYGNASQSLSTKIVACILLVPGSISV